MLPAFCVGGKERYEENHSQAADTCVPMVYLCLDNDEAGEDACESMMEVLADMDVDVERLRPQGKDWNDDLCAKRGGHG